MAENNLLQSTKCLLKDLDAIKNNVTFTSASSEQSVISSKSMELIELSIDEARLMMEFSDYLQKFEMEKHQLQKEVKRLYKENSFLRDELKRTTKNLSTYEQMNSEHIVEIEHLKFLHDVNKYDTSVESLEDEDVNDLFPSSTPATDDDNYPLADVSMITSESAISPSSLSDEFVPSRAQTIRSLVLQYASKQRYEVAIPLCKQTIQDLERTVGHYHENVATMLTTLAFVYHDQSNYQEAVSLLEDVLSIRIKLYGNEHLLVAQTLNNLAVLFSKRQKFKEAESLCKRSLAIKEQHYGCDHVEISKLLNNLALLCKNLDKYDDAELYYKRSIDILTKQLGEHNLSVIKTKNNLASIYLKDTKQYKEAEKIYKNILAYSIVQELPHNLITMILKNLSLTYRRQDKCDLADTLDVCALKMKKHLDPIFVQTLNVIQQTD